MGACRPGTKGEGRALRSGSAGNHCSDNRSLAGRAHDVDIASQTEGSLSHRIEAKVSGKLRARVKARTVVTNLDDECLPG